jgi:phage gpG-like protein
MSAERKLNKWFQEFENRFETAVPNIVAETATEYFKERFTVQDWDGVPWQPLSARYAVKKTRGRGRVLTRSGIMVNSIRPSSVTPQRVTISAGGSKVPYARAHNEGLKMQGIRKVRSYTNKNFMGKGKPVKIKAHTRTVNYQMPKRQFMGHSPLLNKIIMNRLTAAFNSK